MKAIVVHEKGGPEKLIYSEIPDPEPTAGDLLVEVAAAGVNFIDTYHRGGLYPTEFPLVPGVEGAGTVIAVGEGVTEFAPGDRVGWVEGIGSYADRHVVPAARAVPLPTGVSERMSAALLLQGITAHYLAKDTFPLQAGQRCLIHAGAGGVGLLLTQIAKRAGAEVVTTVGSASKADLSGQAGADEVIVYSATDFAEESERRFGSHPFHVVYDGVGAATFDASLDLVRPRGMMVSFGNASGPVPPFAPLILAQKGSLFLTRPTMAHYISTRDELLRRCHDLFAWVEEGSLQVTIGQEYHLSDAAEAHRALEARETTGKVLLLPQDSPAT